MIMIGMFYLHKRMNIDNIIPLAYGMPEEGLGLFLPGNHVYQVIPSERNHRIERVATFCRAYILKNNGK